MPRGGIVKPARIDLDGDVAFVHLTQDKVAVIDAADVPLIAHCAWQARPRDDGHGWYATGSPGRMHRYLIGAERGELVDHRDGDGLNNRRGNLRLATAGQNTVNRRHQRSRYLRGTYPHRRQWAAKLNAGGKQHYLGLFATEEEAHAAYLEAFRKFHGREWVPQVLSWREEQFGVIEAGTRLRSAAPEILDALKAVVAHGDGADPTIQAALRVIAKAEGRQSAAD